MTLNERIDADTKAAMKAGETERVSVLRMAKTALKNEEIALGHPLTDNETILVLAKQAKQREEAAGEYARGGRTELAEKEQREAAVLRAYLPAQLSEDELEQLVDEAIATTGASGPADMGKVMGAVMAKTAGRADGGRVSSIVKRKLAGS